MFQVGHIGESWRFRLLVAIKQGGTKKPASYICDRTDRVRKEKQVKKQVGAHGNRHREGETRAEADQRVAIANGHASEADYRKARERAYAKNTAPQGSHKAIIRLRLVPCCSSSIFGLSRGVEKTLVLMGVWRAFRS